MILGMLIAIPMLGVDKTQIFINMKEPERYFVTNYAEVYYSENGTNAELEEIKKYIFGDSDLDCIGMR